MNIPQLPNKLVFIGDNFVVRIKQLLVFLGMISVIILQHEELLDWSTKEKRNKSIIKLGCLIVLGLNGSPAGKDRK